MTILEIPRSRGLWHVLMYASIMSENAQTDTACDVAQIESLRLNIEQDNLAEGDVSDLPQVLLVQLAELKCG